MPRSPFGFFARLLSFTAVSIFCAAIASAGATQAPTLSAQAVGRGGAEQHPPVYLETVAPQSIAATAAMADYPLDRTLVARADGLGGDGGLYGPVDADDRYRATTGASATPSASIERLGLSLPRPGRVMSVFATIGLIGFFFARRLH